MSHSILAPRNAAALQRAAASNVLVALDFDGTLAPMVERPSSARLRSRTRRLLEQLANRYPTVVLTGRARVDAAARLEGIPLEAIMGNHGLEVGRPHLGAAAMVRRWRRSLARCAWPAGIAVEDKVASLSIHYRASRDRPRARRLILRVARGLNPTPVVQRGKMVLNLLPNIGVNKGSALLDLMRRRRAHGAIYVGDDVTDEDVFALPASARVLSIRVGRNRSTLARYHIASQAHIDELLARLVEARKRAATVSA